MTALPESSVRLEDIATCFSYVLTLQKRSDYGAAERRVSNGKRGEIIEVIAQEGEYITSRYHLPVNGKGQVINPMPEMFEMLKENKIDFSTLPNEVAVGPWKFFELRRVVPRFPRPGEPRGDSYAHRVAQRHLDDQEKDRRFEPRTPVAAIEEPVDEVPVAEPIKRGPGRPPRKNAPA